MSLKRSHSLSIGLVGLPNAGKSTFFNAITKNSVPAENFPFTTIDRNVGVVQVPDDRLDALAGFFNAQKTVPSMITFVDIAGLVKGAADGEGLGNQFLSHIREVDVIMYVLRTFQSEKIIHVYDRVNPLEDLQILQSELILKDLETVKKKLGEAEKKARPNADKATLMELDVLKRLLEWLNQGKMAIDMEMVEDEANFVYDLFLLTFKQQIFVLNVQEGVNDPKRDELVAKFKAEIGDSEFVEEVDVKTLADIEKMGAEEREEYLALLDTRPVMLKDVIKLAFKRLNLITFYTGSEKEVNAWAIEQGGTVKQAAGVIHTDLEHGFITADVVNVEKMVELGGSVKAKEAGLVKNQGKDYITQDGDYVLIYSNR